MSGLTLFQSAEQFYHQGNVNKAFEYYQKSIKKILKDENVTQILPALVPDDFPRETLTAVWRNFLGFFRDPAMSFTQASHPEAYKLLASFRPGASSSKKQHIRLERSPRGRVLLAGMQVTAGMTLGLMAWDQRDRATAAKRYKEALDLARTHASFMTPPPDTVGFERWVSLEIQQTQDNMAVLLKNDEINAAVAEQVHGSAPSRKDVVELPLPQLRVDKTGELTVETTTTIATDACRKCQKRDVKLMRCSACKKVPCGWLASVACFRDLNSCRLQFRVPKGRLEVCFREYFS
jgi:hypothetical protein